MYAHFNLLPCRYTLIVECWNESPDERPHFKDLVLKIVSLLEKVAGYLEFSAFSQTEQLS